MYLTNTEINTFIYTIKGATYKKAPFIFKGKYFMFRKFFILKLFTIFFIYILLAAHSPWGQYHAYRQQHLLI